MALNIKNPRVERRAAEVAKVAGETKTEAIGKALEERKRRLALQGARRDPPDHLAAFLRREVWPRIPAAQKGKRISKAERERILGYGPDGV